VIPPQHVRISLTQHKHLGIPFELAWIKALRSLPKPVCDDSSLQLKEWQEVLKWAKPWFKAAYLEDPEPFEDPLLDADCIAAA
jgi:hypothetical protein